MSFDRHVAIGAGVKSKHIARLLGVSRYTANNWLAGRRSPHDLIQDKVETFMTALNGAIADGQLPIVDEDLMPEEASVQLLQILQERMDKIDQ
jgi:transcriptional regulator with XRE-family HTH domain